MTNHERPLFTGLMARQSWPHRRRSRALFLPILLGSCHPPGRGRRVKRKQWISFRRSEAEPEDVEADYHQKQNVSLVGPGAEFAPC